MITNINYAAKCCVISNIRKHPNADKLQLVTIDNEVAIVDQSYKEGDLVIKFPLECTIHKGFLSYINAFEDKQLNSNKDLKGFFNKHGRVRAIKLRDVFCSCYLVRMDLFKEYFGFTPNEEEFNISQGIVICEKYEVKTREKGANLGKGKTKSKNIDKILDNQFRFHWDTAQLGRNTHKIDGDDVISITYKYHGTSCVSSNILVKRDLNIFEKLLKLLGASINDTEYGLVAASRKVIKSVKSTSLNSHKHYYGDDIWSNASEYLKPFIETGITLYSEIVGYVKSGGLIQGGYDYGCKYLENEDFSFGINANIYVYRITYTTPNGNIIEFSWSQIVDYCNKYGLNYPEILFHGRAKDFSEDIFKSISSIIETNCILCNNKVPMEGYVVRRETRGVEAFKVKSELFRIRESKELDNEVENIETCVE